VPVCHERQIIFLHIPRCGGTSIEESFDLQKSDSLFGESMIDGRYMSVHHMTAQDLLHAELLTAETLDSYFKFTVIRDPFDRMASDYRWHRRHDYSGEFSRLTFKEYLAKAETVIRENAFLDKRYYDHFRPMTDYCVSGGELTVDDVLRLDNIEKEIERLRPRLGDATLSHTNPSADYSELRTEENISMVYEIYQADKYLWDNLEALLQ